jgi:hypothetical protein
MQISHVLFPVQSLADDELFERLPEIMQREIVLEIFEKYLSKEMVSEAIAKVKKLTEDELIARGILCSTAIT